MEDFNTKIPLFKKIDRSVFDGMDKFKSSPNYRGLQDFYTGLEEEQQKAFKGFVLVLMIVIPLAFIGFLMWQNGNIREDLETRVSILEEANKILGQNQGVREIGPRILSMNPIDSSSMMSSRISNLLSSFGVDLGKLQVKEFNSTMISSSVLRAEADFAFNNVTTDELMNIFTAMIQREKFRIENVAIKRSSENNLLQGQFHAIHFSSIAETAEEQ